MMQKKEHILHYMLKGYVHLSKKDYGFFNNLTYIVKEKKQVTTNQDKLFDKLIAKYQRQLKKLGHLNVEILTALTWDVPVIDSSEEYLVPKLYLEGNMICLRSPFNSKFITAFKVAQNNTFIWDKDAKVYRSPFYTHALRLVYDTALSIFDKLDMDEHITSLITPLIEQHGTKAPILTMNEGKYYIDNMNKNLYEAIKDIELNDDPITLYRLSRHGVSIDKSITNEDPFKMFASQYFTKLDIDELFTKLEYFKRLGITDVYTPAQYVNLSATGFVKELLSWFNQHNFKIHHNKDTVTDGSVLLRRVMGNEKIGTLGADSRKIGKVVHVTNSRPIEVR